MCDLTYRRLLFADDPDIPTLATIYQKPEIARYISIGDNYFHYVTESEAVYFYKVYDNGIWIGAIHLETCDTVLFMDILVFPEFQRQGWGTKIVKDLQKDIFGLRYQSIEIFVHETNTASVKLFGKMGFVCIGKEDEMISFVYRETMKLKQIGRM